MSGFKIILAVCLAAILAAACTSKKAEMSLEDYVKINLDIIAADKADKKHSSKEVIVKKYGYTLKQYQDLTEKVDRDRELQQRLDEIRNHNKDGSARP